MPHCSRLTSLRCLFISVDFSRLVFLAVFCHFVVTLHLVTAFFFVFLLLLVGNFSLNVVVLCLFLKFFLLVLSCCMFQFFGWVGKHFSFHF